MYIQRDVFINNENKSAFYKTKGSHFNQTQTMSDLCMIKLKPYPGEHSCKTLHIYRVVLRMKQSNNDTTKKCSSIR